MGAGFQAGHAQDTVAVILQLCRVRIERAPPSRLPFVRQGIGKGDGGGAAALVAAKGAALAAADLLGRAQLHHGQLGKHAIHAADGAEVAAPQSPLIDQATDYRPRRNRQQ